jgi:hypothetical protein
MRICPMAQRTPPQRNALRYSIETPPVLGIVCLKTGKRYSCCGADIYYFFAEYTITNCYKEVCLFPNSWKYIHFLDKMFIFPSK